VRIASHRSIPVLAILSLTLFASCGVWDSFTAYFNTYYNAQHLYAEAEDEIWALPETRESGHNLLVQMNAAQGTKAKFTSVIEKCSKLLQYHPDASLVDDALMMIGRSYYFQNEYQKADRKFRELIDGYPSSDLALQAQSLLSYCQYKSGEFDKAGTTAQAVLERASESGKTELVAEVSLVLGQIALDQKAYARARTAFMRVGDYGNTSEKRTQALMKVAEIFTQEKDYASAEQAYRRAYSLSNSYIGEYRARMGIARMLVKQKRFDEAESALQSLRSNTNYREFFGYIDLEEGNLFRDRGDTLAAIAQYAYVDTAYARTEPAADAGLALAVIYENVLCQYDSARAVLDRAVRSAVNTAESRTEIMRRADYVNKYISYRNDIVKLDSMREAALHPRDTLLVAVTDSSKPVSPAARQDSATTGRPDTTRVAAAKAPPMPLDTIHARLAQRMDDIAGLFYATMGIRDSSRYWYTRLLREYPESRGAPRALYVLARIEAEDSTGSKTRVDSLYREIVKRFPDSPFGEEGKRHLGIPVVVKAADPAAASYGNATALLQSGKSAAAIDSFRAIVRRAPTSTQAPRALYAIGWTYENQIQQFDSAGAVYERLVALYPGSPYAQRVQPRVAEIQSARQAALAPKKSDSTAVAPPTNEEVTKPPSPVPTPKDPEIGKRPPVERRPGQPQQHETPDGPPGFLDDRVAH
jgi:TolA-binding protein